MAKTPTTKTVKEKRYYTKALACPDGSRKYIRGKTKAELDRKVREAQALLGMGININDNTIVAELAQTWVDVYKRPHIKPQSVNQILFALNCHIIPIIGAMRVRDVKPADCARVLSEARHLAGSTQTIILSIVKALFECAIENRIIGRNPVTRSLRPSGAPPQERVPLTSEQMDALCRVAMNYRNPRIYTLVLLCGYAGLRVSEALGLNMKNIDLTAGILYVREQYTEAGSTPGTTPILKSSSSKRDIPIPPVLLAHLASLQGVRPDGYIFNIDQKYLRRRYSKTLSELCSVDRMGEPAKDRRGKIIKAPRNEKVGFYVHPHLLRHTYATRCFEAGLDIKEVQYLLGHSTAKMTMEVYLHYLAQARQEETAQKINNAFSTPHFAIVDQNAV